MPEAGTWFWTYRLAKRENYYGRDAAPGNRGPTAAADAQWERAGFSGAIPEAPGVGLPVCFEYDRIGQRRGRRHAGGLSGAHPRGLRIRSGARVPGWLSVWNRT